MQMLGFLALVIALGGSAGWLVGRHQAPPPPDPALVAAVSEPGAMHVTIGHRRYLFDADYHEAEEVLALLLRAEQMAEAIQGDQPGLDIVMVLHGPDVEFFTHRNYHQHRTIVDLAARLSTQGVMSFKVCQVTLDAKGLSLDDVPSFIRPVAFGPAELQRLRGEGYTSL